MGLQTMIIKKKGIKIKIKRKRERKREEKRGRRSKYEMQDK